MIVLLIGLSFIYFVLGFMVSPSFTIVSLASLWLMIAGIESLLTKKFYCFSLVFLLSIVGAFICSTFHVETTKEQMFTDEIPLYSLNASIGTDISGTFILGFGGVSSEDHGVYSCYHKIADDTFELVTFSAKDYQLKLDDSTEPVARKYFTRNTVVITSCLGESTTVNDYKIQKVLMVPTGTIKREFKGN